MMKYFFVLVAFVTAFFIVAYEPVEKYIHVSKSRQFFSALENYKAEFYSVPAGYAPDLAKSNDMTIRSHIVGDAISEYENVFYSCDDNNGRMSVLVTAMPIEVLPIVEVAEDMRDAFAKKFPQLQIDTTRIKQRISDAVKASATTEFGHKFYKFDGGKIWFEKEVVCTK